MSLNWNWDDKMGEAVYRRGDHETVCNIYQGNALMICVYEDPEEKTYTMQWFFTGMDHLKNCLGLSNDCENNNIFEDMGTDLLRLNTKYKSVPKILEALARAKTNIKIELYNE